MSDDNVDKLIFFGFLFLIFVSFVFGYMLGSYSACDSVHAEWRNGKCVRVIVEEVK